MSGLWLLRLFYIQSTGSDAILNRKWLIYPFLDARTHKIVLESIQKCRSTHKPMRLHTRMDAHACNNACTCTLNTVRLHRIYILQPIRKIDTHSHAGANSCMTVVFPRSSKWDWKYLFSYRQMKKKAKSFELCCCIYSFLIVKICLYLMMAELAACNWAAVAMT